MTPEILRAKKHFARLKGEKGTFGRCKGTLGKCEQSSTDSFLTVMEQMPSNSLAVLGGVEKAKDE